MNDKAPPKKTIVPLNTCPAANRSLPSKSNHRPAKKKTKLDINSPTDRLRFDMILP